MVELPPELILHIISFLTRETVFNTDSLPGYRKPEEPQSLPDLPSINALSRANSIFHRTLNQSLYDACASVEPLGALALLFAVEHRLESAVEGLVAAGVDLDSLFYFEDGSESNVRSLLHVAAGLGHRSMVVKLLAMHGAEMKARMHARTTAPYHRTALDYAARSGHLEVVRVLAPIPSPGPLVDGGSTSDPESAQAHREYLGRALIHSANVGDIEISEYLLSVGADINFARKCFGGTPIFWAARTKNIGLVQFLLDAGADPNIHPQNFRIPLFEATSHGNLDIVQALLSGGADIHAKCRDSKSVLSCCKDTESLRLFLARGVDPNYAEPSGDTPLHHACAAKDPEFAKASIQFLLEFGASTVEHLGRDGLTPVDIALEKGYTEIVKLLASLVQDQDLKLRIQGHIDHRPELSSL